MCARVNENLAFTITTDETVERGGERCGGKSFRH